MSVRAVVFIGGTVLAGIATLSFIGGSFYTVDQGERAVVTNLGRVIGVADPGFHWKVPFTQSAHDIPVRTTLSTWENMASYSRDQQPAELKISIAWRADSGRVEEIYTEYRDLESMASRVLAPRATQAIKVVFGRFNAATSISERARLNTETAAEIMSSMGDAPLIIESVQIENIDFSDAYEQSVEQRMLAEVEVTKIAQNAQREVEQAKITVTKANADADAQRAKAQAEADTIRLRAVAEAEAIRSRGAALRDNPSLIDLTKAERWDGKLPVTMVPGSAIPFLDVGRP